MNLLLLSILMLCRCGFAADITLAWDPNSETNVIGYVLHRGNISGGYYQTNSIAGRTNTTCVWSNLPPGRSFWAVTAVAADGIESDYSNEVSYTNRGFAPKTLRILSLSASVQGAPSIDGPWAVLKSVTLPLEATNAQRFYRAQMALTSQ